MVKETTSFLWFLSLIALQANIANAETHVPKGCKLDVFLTVSGKVGKTTSSNGDAYEMSEKEFLALPPVAIKTATPWTPKSAFSGPLLGTLLKNLDAKGKKLRLIAFDDFTVEVDAGYLEKYGTILAVRKDGTRLTIRDFGPIFVMYPRDEFKDELDTPATAADLVWQLCGIEVE